MKRLGHHDDFGIRLTLLLAIQTCQFDRAFVGLRATVSKKHMIHAGQRSQAIGNGILLGHLIQIRYVDQLCDLLL